MSTGKWFKIRQEESEGLRLRAERIARASALQKVDEQKTLFRVLLEALDRGVPDEPGIRFKLPAEVVEELRSLLRTLL